MMSGENGREKEGNRKNVEQCIGQLYLPSPRQWLFSMLKTWQADESGKQGWTSEHLTTLLPSVKCCFLGVIQGQSLITRTRRSNYPNSHLVVNVLTTTNIILPFLSNRLIHNICAQVQSMVLAALSKEPHSAYCLILFSLYYFSSATRHESHSR